MRHLRARYGVGPALHGTAGSASKVIGFGLLLLYGHVLPPEDFGVLALLYLTTYLLDAVIIQGLTAKILRQHTEAAGGDALAQRSVITTAFVHTVISAAALFGFLALAAGPVSGLLFHERHWSQLFQCMCAAGCLRAAQHVPRQMLRARGRRSWLDALRLGDALTAAALNTTLVIGAGLGLSGVVYGEVLRETFFALVFVATLRRDLCRRLSGSALRALLRDGWPRLRQELPSLVLATNDRYFLAAWTPLGVVGTYGFGLRLAQALGDFVLQPLLGLVPSLRRPDETGDAHEQRQILGRFATYFVALAGLAALAIAVFAGALLRILCQPQYEGVAWLLPLLLMALLLAGVHRLLLVALRLERRSTVSAGRVTAAAALFSLVGNAVLVPSYGALGAALTAVIAQALLCATAIVAARRAALLHWEAGRLAKVIAALFSTSYIAGFVMPDNLVGQVAAAWAMVLLYPALLGVLGFYTMTEIEKMRDLLNHRVGPASTTPTAAATTPAPLAAPAAAPELVGSSTRTTRS